MCFEMEIKFYIPLAWWHSILVAISLLWPNMWQKNKFKGRENIILTHDLRNFSPVSSLCTKVLSLL